MIGKLIAVIILVVPLAGSIYFLVVKKKVRLPWFVTALLGLVAFMSLVAISLFIFTMVTFQR